MKIGFKENREFIIAFLGTTVKLLDLVGQISITTFSVPLSFGFILLMLLLIYPLQESISQLSESYQLERKADLLIVTVIISFTSYLFVIMGMANSYYMGIVFFIISLILYTYVFYDQRASIKKIINENNRKIISASLVISLIFPAGLSIIDPIFNEPKITISPNPAEMSIQEAMEPRIMDVVIKNIRGRAWNIKVNIQELYSNFFYIYIDGILHGEKRINGLVTNEVVKIPVELMASRDTIDGEYDFQIICSYTNYRRIQKIEKIQVSVFYNIEHPVMGQYAAYLFPLAIITIIIFISRSRRLRSSIKNILFYSAKK